ncbi:hypothetical protein D910_07325 [Dendroctonus ponderosae]|uniref:Phosphatidylinositol-glycan biosynthesis class F protein n=1 Tax=Dendroctonus ponderosae TaxID=77166 RepID=U4UH92_DENPD|nr:hypothetical protein D910_07325 [Dendroctonus ponderosae]
MSLNPQCMAINNVVSCCYVALTILWLKSTSSLYQIGDFRETYLQSFLITAEVLKYLAFGFYAPSAPKKPDSKDSKRPGWFKSTFTILSEVLTFYIVAVLFGAPFLSKQHENLTFAITMTVLVVLPCCLYMGTDKSVVVLLSLISPAGNDQLKPFFRISQFTCLGAWLGAIVVPLDWNKPYQVWPIPAILGALAGYFFGHLFLLSTYLLQKKFTKRTLKSQC